METTFDSLYDSIAETLVTTDMPAKPEPAPYTAYLKSSADGEQEITIVNKYGHMINDFPVITTKVEALESYGWELVSRVWKDASEESSPYGNFKIAVQRARNV